MSFDPGLYDIMHGIQPTKQNASSKTSSLTDAFDIAIENAIKKEADQKLLNEDPSQNKLLSMEARRAKIEKELRDFLDLSQLGKHLTIAFNILRNEGTEFLEKDEYQRLIEILDKQRDELAKLDPSNLNEEHFESIVAIDQNNLNSILKVGIGKFSEGLFPESLSIFALLSSSAASNPDYWYRLGLVAKKCDQFDLAIRSFAITSMLVPEFIGSHIYAAQCYLNLDQHESAEKEFIEATKLLEKSQTDEKWQKHIEDIEILLAAHLVKGD